MPLFSLNIPTIQIFPKLLHKSPMKRSQYLLSLAIAFAFGIIVSKALPAFHKAPAKKATGIGGIFFKCKDPKKMREWYAKELGL